MRSPARSRALPGRARSQFSGHTYVPSCCPQAEVAPRVPEGERQGRAPAPHQSTPSPAGVNPRWGPGEGSCPGARSLEEPRLGMQAASMAKSHIFLGGGNNLLDSPQHVSLPQQAEACGTSQLLLSAHGRHGEANQSRTTASKPCSRLSLQWPSPAGDATGCALVPQWHQEGSRPCTQPCPNPEAEAQSHAELSSPALSRGSRGCFSAGSQEVLSSQTADFSGEKKKSKSLRQSPSVKVGPLAPPWRCLLLRLPFACSQRCREGLKVELALAEGCQGAQAGPCLLWPPSAAPREFGVIWALGMPRWRLDVRLVQPSTLAHPSIGFEAGTPNPSGGRKGERERTHPRSCAVGIAPCRASFSKALGSFTKSWLCRDIPTNHRAMQTLPDSCRALQ